VKISSRIFAIMDLPIFYIEKPASSDFITLGEETSRHVVQVLRMQHGEKIQLTDGAGTLVKAEIVDPHKKKATVRLIENTFLPQKENRVSIGISLLKNGSRFEWFLEKATEIGVTEIFPLLCSRTEKQHFRYDRMQQILISAMMQSKQFWLPTLHEPTAINNVITNSTYNTRLIAHCEDETKNPITNYAKHSSVQMLIGPEGDFTNDEIELALHNNFQPVTLGENRLRTETAGIVGATVLCI
jgi:16S rRNA (uracil1498-N3)-methyltransferase